MSLTVDCKNLKGKITVPYSKSMAHRYLIANYLAGNYEIVRTFDETNISNDVLTTKMCIEALISGRKPVTIDVNESGTTLRFLISIIAALGIEAEIKVRGTLKDRPMSGLLSELLKHRVSIETDIEKEILIYRVSGKLSSGEYHISGDVSSQFISSLLFALPLLDGQSSLCIDGEIESKPYIDLTLYTLEKFGLEISTNINDSRSIFTISGNQKYICPDDAGELLEGDWSSGSMWLVANSVLNKLNIEGLDIDSLQADAFIQDILEIEDGLDVIISGKDCPDLVPTISLWALSRNGETTITGLNRLKYKESNRLVALQEIITELGGNAKVIDNTLVIVNSKHLSGTVKEINTFNDHRLVMFASFASLITNIPVTINNPEAVSKSYPNFFSEIERLGGVIKWN